MNLSDISIRRPVFASMSSAALVLFGIIGYRELAVREFPDVDPPIVSVSVSLRGANPQVMESAVTDVLEEQLASLEGLRTMTSSSSEQSSNINLEFNLDRPIEDAAQDVRDIVSRVRGRLPQEIDDPVVNKQDADARPIMFIGLESDAYDLLQLSETADRILKPQLQSGMFIEARLETAVRPAATVIPEDAVSPMQGSMFVWVVKDGKAERREVVLGVRTPGYVEVRQGIEPGDQVVVGGSERLSPGAEVRAAVVDRTPRGAGPDVTPASR